MQNSKKLFGRLNGDDDERLLPETDYINLENCTISQNEFSKNFAVQNIPSSQTIFDGTDQGIALGTATDYQNKRLFWIDHADAGVDTLFAYDLNLKITYIIVVSTQIIGDLNLNDDFRIDRNFKIIDNLAIWTDFLNEIKSIDIEAGIKLNQPGYVTNVQPYGTPIPYETTTLIKRPPIYRLQVQKGFDVTFINNFILNNAYQFCYRYQYKNYQYSCLSTFSQLMPYNAKADNSNFISVKMNFTEIIPDYVLQIDFCVRYGNTGKTLIIRSFNKNNPYDLIAINSHNSATVQLGITFYDNFVGIELDDITANTSFHDVALLTKTLEAAKNRLFLANNLKGYNTPNQTSLSTSLGTFDTGGGTFTGIWKFMTLNYYLVSDPMRTPIAQNVYYAYIASLPTTSYYYTAYASGAGLPGTVDASDATSAWDTESNLASYIIRNNIDVPMGGQWLFFPTPAFTATATSVDVIVAPTSNLQFFKSSSIYDISIAFFDRFRRKCGVVSPFVRQSINTRTYNQTVFATDINWSLSNINAVAEIPDWAYFYQIHISRNQTYAFFVQIFCNNSNYVIKNQDGTFTYGTTFTANVTYAIAIDLTALTNVGLGYTFTEGDLGRIYFNTGISILYRVLGIDGNFVFLSPFDIGTLGTGVGFLIELFTPYKPVFNEPMFETGDVFPILNPATNIRTYSTTSGSLNGDAYAIERNNGIGLYFVEAMSPNDNIWQFWQIDRGWTNFIDTIGQQLKDTTIDWTNTFIGGSKTNGLNIVQPLNEKDVGSSSGSIQKLQLTNKMEESGTVMLVITDTDTLSAYLGEVQLYNAATIEGLITTVDVIGSINALQNGQGTINPESVVEYNGTVWWINVLKGVVAQYSTNGVDNVSDTKMRRFFDRFSKRYVFLGKAGVKTLCGFSHIAGCVDITNGHYMLTLPQVEENIIQSGIPIGFADPLPSYDSLPPYASSIQNRFDFYDGQAKIVNYDFNNNKWIGANQWLPECMEYFGNKLFALDTGYLYLMNESTTDWNNIFGVQYPQRICFTTNIPPSEVRSIFNIALESEQIPNFTVLMTTWPNQQITDLTADDYSNQEGVMYAEFFRDRLSPNVIGTVIDKLYQGDVMIGAVGFCMLEFQIYNEQMILNFSNIGFQVSRGQKNVLNITK